MSSSGQRGKERMHRNRQRNEQTGRPSDERPDPSANEQEYFQGVSPQRYDFFPPGPTLSTEDYTELGAPQNLYRGQSINDTANNRGTIARYQTSGIGNTTMTNSNNTVDYNRTYNQAKHNEFTNSAFNAPVNYGDINYHFAQPGPPMDAQMYGGLQNLVQTIGWDILLGQLLVVNQDEQRSRISPFDRNKPENFWISKNIDFTQWESANTPWTLLLCAPHGHATTEVCSHLAKENASWTHGPVLYFFCSSAPKAQRSTILTHTLLYQIVYYSDARKANSIAAAFLSTLVGRHFRRRSTVFSEDDPLDTTMMKILDALDEELIEALAEAIKKAGIRKLSIIVDDLWEGFAAWFVHVILEAAPELKALLTSRHNSLENLPAGILCIEHDKERQECLRSLRYDNTRFDKISDEHHGSLVWLWKHPQYRKWSESTTSSLLYIEGKPGSGKSTLAKYFEKNLAKRDPNASLSTVAHYFYTFRGTVLESTHENMLRSILHSILEQDESAFFHFQQEFRDFRRHNHSEWPYESLKRVLSSFANHPPTKPLYLILDAMDESEEGDRRSIIELICQLCSNENPCNIKVFLASRPVAELTYRIRERHQVITIQDQNKDDIARFAVDFLKTDLRMSGKVFHEALDYITHNAHGVFVWVNLVKTELLTRIERGRPEAEILDCLKAIPRDLENTYKDMFNRLEHQQSEVIQDSIRVFRFVLFALRPLTVIELRDALALSDDHKPSREDIQQNLRAVERRIKYCAGNFLEIKVDETVQFMHQTARQFLIRTIPNASNLKFEINQSHRVMTITWIRYLMLCFTTPIMRDEFSKIQSWSPRDFRAYAEYLNEWPLVEYTLCYIKDHHDICGWNEEVSQHVTILLRKLAENQASYFIKSFIDFRFGYNNGQAIPVNKHQEISEDIKYNTLNAAAEPKLPHVVNTLLLTCTQDDNHAEQKTPLIISAQKGLVRAIQLFLELNVNKDAKDNSGRTALHYAAESGHEAIVRLLVEQRANKRIRDSRGKTALHLAVEKFLMRFIRQPILNLGHHSIAIERDGLTK
ncbi:hypothetical protein BDD12DRAFT_806269 [Trichophaea hybrida]|nr:hypothetical protein BDD12DRAFT_806269 [Trichophaea hybrida]